MIQLQERYNLMRQVLFYFSYKNGSLTREVVRDETSEGSWDLFNQLLDSTPRGNFGNIGNFYCSCCWRQLLTPLLYPPTRFNFSSYLHLLISHSFSTLNSCNGNCVYEQDHKDAYFCSPSLLDKVQALTQCLYFQVPKMSK